MADQEIVPIILGDPPMAVPGSGTLAFASEPSKLQQNSAQQHRRQVAPTAPWPIVLLFFSPKARMTRERRHIPAGNAVKPPNRWESGAPGKTRTSNPQIRSLVLYPIELRVPRGGGDVAQGPARCKSQGAPAGPAIGMQDAGALASHAGPACGGRGSGRATSQGSEGSNSFLKKRTKKLLFLALSQPRARS